MAGLAIYISIESVVEPASPSCMVKWTENEDSLFSLLNMQRARSKGASGLLGRRRAVNLDLSHAPSSPLDKRPRKRTEGTQLEQSGPERGDQM